MDRHDESKDRTDELDERQPGREGDILGLSGAVPKEPGDPTTEHDPTSVAKRRARALGAKEAADNQENPNRQGGATGIDMGAGGQGTLLGGD